MYQEGEITIAECSECKEAFPVFTFVADTDMVTSGCIALTSKDKKIALSMQSNNETQKEIESRVGSTFKIVAVRHESDKSNQGESFQQFLKTYKPAKAIYTCIYCGSSAYGMKTETKEQFLTHGELEVINGS